MMGPYNFETNIFFQIFAQNCLVKQVNKTSTDFTSEKSRGNLIFNKP